MKPYYLLFFCLLLSNITTANTGVNDPSCSSCTVSPVFDGCYNIPVIVHIIHDSEDAYPEGTNLECDRICDQILVLNEDFRKANADVSTVIPFFQNYVGDAQISFYLYEVIRVPVNSQSFPLNPCNLSGISSPEYDAIGGIIPLNIWVTDIGELNAASSISATVTGTPCNTQNHCSGEHGIYVDFKAFGRGEQYALNPAWTDGRVVTHETGHWLGLRHPWGANPQNNFENCDCIFDTPEHSVAAYCTTNEINLANNVCNDLDGPMNLQNFMGYTQEPNCRVMFTKGQTVVMRNTIRAANNLPIKNSCDDIDISAPADPSPLPLVGGIGNTFAIFPNPVDGVLNLSWPSGQQPETGEVTILSITGQMIKTTLLDNTISVAHLPKGIYLIRIEQNGAILSQQKFVKT